MATGVPLVFDERQSRSQEEALFSKVFQASPSQMALTDAQTGKYAEVNETFLRTLGFTRAEVVGKTASELNLFVDPDQRAVLLGKMSQQGYLRNENVLVRTRSGELRYGIFTAEYVEIEQRRFLLTVMDDVTERRQAEEALKQSEAQYHAMIANAKDMVVIVDGQGLFKFVSPASSHIMGYSPEELLGHDFRETIHPDDLRVVNESFVHRGQVAGRARETLKVRILHKDGNWRVLEALGTSMFNDPTVRGLVMNVRDVTEQEAATTALRESEIRYRGLFEDSPLALLEQDFSAVKARLTALRQNGISDFKTYFKEHPDEVAACAALIKVLDVNKAAVELFRAQKKEDLLKDLAGYLDGEAIHGFEDELVFLTADQAEFEWEGVNKTVDGKLIDIQLKFCAAPDHHHDLSRVIVSIRDVTAWKKANWELKETHDRLLEAQQLSHLGHWEWNLDEQKLTWSDEVYRIFNVSPIDFVVSVEAFESFIHPDDKEDFLRHRAQMLEEKKLASIDHRIVLADGQVRHVQERTQLLLGEDGKVVRVMGTVQDITERKEAEEKLRKNEALLSEAQRLGHVGHWEWVDGQLTGSDEFFRIFGLPVGDYHISLQDLGKALNPGMVEPMRILDRAIFEKRTDMNYEFSIPTLEGGKRWLHQYAKITYAETGRPQYMLGIIRDITDFKTAEETALRRNNLLQEVQQMASIQSWVLNTQTGTMTIGPGDDQIMEWQAGDYTQQDLLPMIHPEDLSWVLSAWSETTKNNKNLDLEYRILVNGKLKWIHVKTAYGIEESSSPYVIGFSQDITERKQAEELNAAQRNLARLVSDDAPISVIWKAALQSAIRIAGLDCGGIYYFNSDLRELELIEYTELSEKFVNAVRRIPENSLGMQELLAGKALYLSEAELTLRELDRDEGLHSLAIIPIQHQGELIGCINVASHKIDQIPDVSRLSLEALSSDIGNILIYRRADEALRLSEEKYRLLAENISDVIWILDLEEARFRYISPSILQLRGYSVEEVLAQPMMDSLMPDSAVYLAEVLPQRIEEFEQGISKTYMDELEQPCKDGSTVSTETTTRFTRHSTTGKLEVYGVSRDITKRKIMERQLRETLNKLEGAEEQAGFGSWYFDVSSGTGWWSKQMCRLFEWDPALGTPEISTYLAMIHPQDRDRLALAMDDMLHGRLPEQSDYRIITRSGIEKILSPFYHVVRDQAGNVLRFSGTVLDITERVRAEDEIQRMEKRYRSLIEHAPDGIVLVGLDGKFKYASQSASRIFGYSYDEITDLDPNVLTHPEDLTMVVTVLGDLIQNPKQTPTLQYRFLHKDGSWRWIESTFSNLMAEPAVEGIAINFHDITESKQAGDALKVSEENYRSLAETSDSAIAVLNRQGVILYANPVSMRVWSDTNIVGRTLYDLFPREIADAYHAVVRRVIDEQLVDTNELEVEVRGQQMWFHVSMSPIKNGDGVVDTLLFNALDITERKLVEKDLRASEERLRIINEYVDDILWQVNPDFRFVYVSPAVERVLGYSSEESIKLYVTDILDEAGFQTMQAVVKARLTGVKDGNTPTEYLMKHKDGHWVDVEVLSSPVWGREQNLIGYVGITRDITERKRAEMLVHAQHDLVRAISKVNTIQEGLRICLETTLHLSGLDSGGFYKLSDTGELSLLYHTGLGEEFVKEVAYYSAGSSKLTSGISDQTRYYTAEHELFRNSIYEREGLTSALVLPVLYQGRMVGSLVLGSHHLAQIPKYSIQSLETLVTEVGNFIVYTEIQNALRESQVRSQAMLNAIPDMMFRLDRNGIFLDYKADTHELYAQELPSLVGLRNRDISPVEFADLIEEKIQVTLETGKVQTFEYQLSIPTQGQHDYEARMAPSGRDEVVAIVRDITERKTMERNIIQSNQRFTELAENVSDIFWVSEPGTRTNLYVSPAFSAIIGRDPVTVEQMPGGYLDIVLPEDQEAFSKGRETESSGFKTDMKYRIRRPDGSTRWIHDKGTPVFDENGKVVRVVGLASDITDQVEAERRLYESEMRFRQIAESIKEVFWMYDYAEQRIIYISPGFELIWGHSVNALYEDGRLYLIGIHSQDQQTVFTALEQQSNGEPTEIEYRVVRPDGSISYIHDRSFPVYDEEAGTLIRTAGIAIDVTERKRTDEALQDSEERLRLSLSAGKLGMYDLNVQTGHTIVNREYAEMLGYDPTMFVETNAAWMERLHPDDRERVSQIYADYLSGGLSEYRVEFRQKTKSGAWKWILSIGKLVAYDVEGKPLRLLGTHTDITRLKEAEFELEKRASQMALINDVGRKIASILDIQGILDLSAGLVQESFGYHHVGMFTMSEDHTELVMRSRAGKYAQFFPEAHRVKLGKGVVGSIGESGTMLLVNQADTNSGAYINYFPEHIHTLSELGLPIKIAGEVVGVLDVQSPLPNAFTAEDIQVLQTLVDQVAIAMENARLYESVQTELVERRIVEKERQVLIHNLGERVKELTALHQAARLFQNLHLSEMELVKELARILPPAWQYPEITVVRIYLGELNYATPGFVETPWMQIETFNLPNGETGKIEIAYLEERPVEAEGSFLLEERNLLETLSERLQSALLRRSIERDLQKRTEDLSNLLEAGYALTETLDPHKIYPIIYQYIAGAMPCDFLVLSSFDPKTELITCEYMHSSEGSQDVSGFPPIPLEPPGRGTQSRVIRSGESLLLPDYERVLNTANTTMYFDEKAEIYKEVSEDEERTRSAIIVPLKVNGLVAGAMQVFSVNLNAHTQDHLRFAEALALHVSAALSNARLFLELEERVRQRTAEVQDLYDNAPAGYHSLDVNGNFSLINQTELNWLGYTREEIIGKPITDFLSPTSLDTFREIFAAFKKEGSLSGLEMEFRRKNGSIFPVLINATAVKNDHGDYITSRSTVFDNTERKQIELALREREETYRALFESANDAIFMTHPNGHILRANPRCTDLLGLSSEEIIGKNAMDFIVPGQEIEASNQLNRLLTGESLPVYERKMLRKDGSTVEAEINLSLIRDENGQPKFIQSVVRDISARKIAENALRESEEQNRLLFEEAPEAVILFDQDGRVVRINHAFQTVSGLPGSQFIGHTVEEMDFLPKDIITNLTEVTLNALQNKDGFAELDFKLQHVSGELRDINTHVFALNLQGQQHYLASIHDITTSKRAEENLRLANAEMERALRLKDEFLANMSHELRTPLNAVLGITESLLEQISGPLNEKQQKYLQTVLESGQHLLELINDILDLAKISAGRIELDLTKVDVNTIAQSSLRMVRESAQKKRLNISLNVDETVKQVRADERRLKQILVNLLSNAVKFTPTGGQIGLDITADPKADTLRFIVWDTGIGIHQKDLHLLFQPFVQLDAGLARGSQGTGLGLVLVSQMARLHGGNVTVESEPQKGSRFIVSIPWLKAGGTAPLKIIGALPRSDAPSMQVLLPNTGGNKTILVVDDTDSVTQLIHDYLKLHGYQVVTARDGFEGLARAGEVHPDLILMDVMMPEMDGLETTRLIRSQLGMKDVPIVAMTALAMAGDRERCLEAGMNEYLSKPVKLGDLLHTIETQLTLAKRGKQ
ncbi:MAG: PAS domain S-box protein [Anaerolineales bacterium]|uniref:PAS domain S-box protein n=1 Tax=Candidatus Villigracilis vicinus TaxID=3140679 RepID=UPI0031359D27|nr:PAS domain S-box protein [Anaerolineales bacterium]